MTLALPGCAEGATVYGNASEYVDGNEAMQNLGRSVALADVNLDGISDLVVGAPYTTAGGMRNAGSVVIYASAAGVPMANVIVINGTSSWDLFGWTVADVGDINGDGAHDLAIGAPLADPGGRADAGTVYLFFAWAGFDGTCNSTIEGANEGEELGFALSAAGDINKDGFDDLIAGAPFYTSGTLAEAGRVYIYYGGSPMDKNPDRTFTGSSAGAHLGWSVSGGASVDGDTKMDVVAGAPGQGTAGAAYVIRNLDRTNPTVTVVTGKRAYENFSFSVALVPDLNGDLIGDIAIGAPTNSDNGSCAGAVYVLFGSSKFNTVVDMTLTGAPDEWFGWAVVSGDMREDGVSDLLVGAPNSRLNETAVGRAYVYFGGASISEAPNMTLVPDSGASFFGGSLAVGPNMTGDPAPDYAVGDPLFNVPGYPNAGRVYLYSGVHVVVPKNPVGKGHVYIPGTTVGLSGFTVTLESDNNAYSTTTDSSGAYELMAIPGTYWLNVSRTGYVPNSTTITLATNEVAVLDFYPLTVPYVRGTVRDAVSSTALRGATVALYAGGGLKAWMTTPANGSYWFWLPEDLVPPVGGSVTVTVAAWSSMHYTSSTDIILARNDSVVSSFALDRFPVVTGSVRDALFLSAIRNALVTANQGASVLAATVTDIRGEYEIVAVNATAGSLYLNVTASGYFRQTGSVAVEKNGTYTLNFILQVDNAPPSSQLAALPQYVTTENFTISATATDLNGIKEVQLWYRLGSSGAYAKYGSDYEPPYVFTFTSSAAGGDGLYEFYSLAVDLADNTEPAPATNDTWTFVDAHAPELAVSEPSEGAILPVSTVAVVWSGSDSGSGIVKYEVKLDSGEWVDKELSTSHEFASVGDGPHTVTVRASDFAGLQREISVHITVDTRAPTSAMSALPSVTASSNLTLAATATDLNGIKEVQFWYRYGGSGGFSLLGSDDSPPYELAFSAEDHEGDGLYEFYSLAVDLAGNGETAPAGNKSWTIVDTALPLLTITWPVQGGTVGTASLTVNWTASDSASGIWKYWIRLDDGPWVELLNSSTQMSVQVEVTHGEHTINVTATDRAGWNRSVSVTFGVDLNPPVVTITTPLEGQSLASAAITLRWSASDQDSGIASVEVSRDGVAWLQVGVADTEYTFSAPAGLPEGEHTVWIRVTDRGGLATYRSATVTLDRTPPVVAITYPLDGDTVRRSTITVRWQMADSGSGVKTAYVSIDKGVMQNIGDVSSFELSDLTDGEHEVRVRVVDEAGNAQEVSVSFTVDTGARISTLLIGGIAIAVIAAAAIGAALMMRKKRPGKGEAPDASLKAGENEP
ncbi:MAG: Ig-like domain-containing protein [Thermoplasmata archaeon]